MDNQRNESQRVQPSEDQTKESVKKTARPSKSTQALQKGAAYIKSGLPIREMPTNAFFELASRIGNSAVLDLLAQGNQSIEISSGMPITYEDFKVGDSVGAGESSDIAARSPEPSEITTQAPELTSMNGLSVGGGFGLAPFGIGGLADRSGDGGQQFD